jgi:hypothetical protein
MTGITGITVSKDIAAFWNEFQFSRKHRYVIFSFSSDSKEIVIEKKGERGETYEIFLDSLPPKDVRYAAYHYDYVADDGSQRSKTVLLNWSPDVASARKKMMLAGSSGSLKNALTGVQVHYTASDESDLLEEVMKERCVKTSH